MNPQSGTVDIKGVQDTLSLFQGAVSQVGQVLSHGLNGTTGWNTLKALLKHIILFTSNKSSPPFTETAP